MYVPFDAKLLSSTLTLCRCTALLFLDEPTSGLDSAAAFNIVLMLRRLCQAGRTVICTIHQPSSEVFHLCDKVMLLSKGNQVYLGPAKEMETYFMSLGHQCPPSTNPADFVRTIAHYNIYVYILCHFLL